MGDHILQPVFGGQILQALFLLKDLTTLVDEPELVLLVKDHLFSIQVLLAYGLGELETPFSGHLASDVVLENLPLALLHGLAVRGSLVNFAPYCLLLELQQLVLSLEAHLAPGVVVTQLALQLVLVDKRFVQLKSLRRGHFHLLVRADPDGTVGSLLDRLRSRLPRHPLVHRSMLLAEFILQLHILLYLHWPEQLCFELDRLSTRLGNVQLLSHVAVGQTSVPACLV